MFGTACHLPSTAGVCDRIRENQKTASWDSNEALIASSEFATPVDASAKLASVCCRITLVVAGSHPKSFRTARPPQPSVRRRRLHGPDESGWGRGVAVLSAACMHQRVDWITMHTRTLAPCRMSTDACACAVESAAFDVRVRLLRRRTERWLARSGTPTLRKDRVPRLSSIRASHVASPAEYWLCTTTS